MRALLSALTVILFGGFAQAQTPTGLPSSATFSYSVVNISQGNADASVAAARPGDTLRYEVAFTSDTEDVENFVASVDVSGILAAADMIDAGLGVLSGGTLSFPPYTQKAPCGKKLTFFVRVKRDCGTVGSMASTANGTVSNTVQLNCEAPAVVTPTETPTPTVPHVSSGPNAANVIGFIIFLTVLLGIQLATRRQ